MKKTVLILLSCLMLVACKSVPTFPYNGTTNINQVAPYPDPRPGYSRFAIFLPRRDQEFNYRVELLIGKDMIVDCNTKILAGTVTKKTIKGWDYPYYVVESKGQTISTLKVCPTSQERLAFVSIPDALNLVNYNSSAPIVVYAPGGLQVNYRIWQITNGMFTAIKQ